MGRGPALETRPGLETARLCIIADLDTTFGGRPRPTQWGLFCGWQSSDARDEFLQEPAPLGRFLDGASETWSVSLDTVRVVMGDLHGWRPTTDEAEPLGMGEPLVAMTYGRVKPRHLPVFTWNNRKIIREMVSNPGLGMMVGLADEPLARCTISLWRSKGEMVRFAYGQGVHDPVQRRSLEVPWGADWFFARFRPVSTSGSWGGRDPLAEWRVAPPA